MIAENPQKFKTFKENLESKKIPNYKKVLEENKKLVEKCTCKDCSILKEKEVLLEARNTKLYQPDHEYVYKLHQLTERMFPANICATESENKMAENKPNENGSLAAKEESSSPTHGQNTFHNLPVKRKIYHYESELGCTFKKHLEKRPNIFQRDPIFPNDKFLLPSNPALKYSTCANKFLSELPRPHAIGSIADLIERIDRNNNWNQIMSSIYSTINQHQNSIPSEKMEGFQNSYYNQFPNHLPHLSHFGFLNSQFQKQMLQSLQASSFNPNVFKTNYLLKDLQEKYQKYIQQFTFPNLLTSLDLPENNALKLDNSVPKFPNWNPFFAHPNVFNPLSNSQKYTSEQNRLFPEVPFQYKYYESLKGIHSKPPKISFQSKESPQQNNGSKERKAHRCMYCGKDYSRKYGLKIHIRTHTGYKPLKCKICGRPFGDPSNLNKHVRLHAEGDTPYRCDICGKVLVRRRDLERHIKSRHSNNS